MERREAPGSGFVPTLGNVGGFVPTLGNVGLGLIRRAMETPLGNRAAQVVVDAMASPAARPFAQLWAERVATGPALSMPTTSREAAHGGIRPSPSPEFGRDGGDRPGGYGEADTDPLKSSGSVNHVAQSPPPLAAPSPLPVPASPSPSPLPAPVPAPTSQSPFPGSWARLQQVVSRGSVTPIWMDGLLSRLQTTLRGSRDDIGWLQREPGLSPVHDGTEHFDQITSRISHGVHTLPDTLVYLLVPGLFSNHGPLCFVDAKKYLMTLGLTCHIARIHSELSVETNAFQIKEHVEELHWGTGKKVVLLGHSKGAVDSAAALAVYWDELKEKVVGLVLVQSPYGGTPVASDMLREGQFADAESRTFMRVIMDKVFKGELQALEDLTYEKRRQFLAKHPLPSDLPVVSFHTEVDKGLNALGTLTPIAHADIPVIVKSPQLLSIPSSSTGSRSGSRRGEDDSAPTTVPVLLPIAAAMKAMAMHLEVRYGAKSDGLVTRLDAEVPGSVAVRPERKMDHSGVVYSNGNPSRDNVDGSQIIEALLTLLLESATEIWGNSRLSTREATEQEGRRGKSIWEESESSVQNLPRTTSWETEWGLLLDDKGTKQKGEEEDVYRAQDLGSERGRGSLNADYRLIESWDYKWTLGHGDMDDV